MNKASVFNVKNRSTSHIVYTIPDKNLRREFLPGENKIISYEELEALNYQPGGRALMANFLQITSEEALNSLQIKPEAEYFMSEEQVAELISVGTLDAFLDCLDYAPQGVIDLIKTLSIKIPMTDTRKIEALNAKTGFNVTAALANKKAAEEEEPLFNEAKKETTPVEKKPPVNTGRRTNTNYKIVTPKEN